MYMLRSSLKSLEYKRRSVNLNYCHEIISNLHEKEFFNKKVFCRGVVYLDTPTKEDSSAEHDTKEDEIEQNNKEDSEESKEASKGASKQSSLTKKKEEPKKENNNKTEQAHVSPVKNNPLTKKQQKKHKQKMAKLEAQKKKHTQADFLKNGDNVFVNSDDSEEEVSDDSVEENEVEPFKQKKFFQRSPIDSCSEAHEALLDPLLTPRRFSSAAAKRIEKEETWKINVEKSQTKSSKRPLTSPTDNSRNVRPKSVSRLSGLRAPQNYRK